MARWAVPLFLTLLASFWVFAHHGYGDDLLIDTDTKVALQAIEARHAPLSWFTTDWPLENHFYRPLPTLSLETDLAAYGHHGTGFGITNGLLCAAGVLLTYWMFFELTESFGIACLCAILFAALLTGDAGRLGFPCQVFGAGVFLCGLWRHGKRLRMYVPVALLLYYLGDEFAGVGPGFIVRDLPDRVLAWIPGRTATIMAVFAFAACAAYARYERLGSQRDAQREITPLDLPATRTSVQYPIRLGQHWIWAVFAFFMTALALASYEQAIMVPAALTGIAIMLRLRGLRVRWAWQVAFWLLIPAYLAVRHGVIPAGVSRYQAQQFRNGPGLYWDLANTLFPNAGTLRGLWVQLESPLILLDGGFWMSILAVAANISALILLRKRWVLGYGSLLLSLVTFLPMAWAKYFAHYGYWPAACRSLYVICLAWVAIEAVVTAVSPPAIPAPERPHLAPGSLPHL